MELSGGRSKRLDGQSAERCTERFCEARVTCGLGCRTGTYAMSRLLDEYGLDSQ